MAHRKREQMPLCRPMLDEAPQRRHVGIVGMKPDRDRVERKREAVERAAQSFAGCLDQRFLQGPEAQKRLGLPSRRHRAQDRNLVGAEEPIRDVEIRVARQGFDVDADIVSDADRARHEAPGMREVELQVAEPERRVHVRLALRAHGKSPALRRKPRDRGQCIAQQPMGRQISRSIDLEMEAIGLGQFRLVKAGAPSCGEGGGGRHALHPPYEDVAGSG